MTIYDKIGLGMNVLKRKRVASFDKKTVKSSIMWFDHERRRSLEVPIRRIHRMEDSPLLR